MARTTFLLCSLLFLSVLIQSGLCDKYHRKPNKPSQKNRPNLGRSATLETDPNYWINAAQDTLRAKLNQKPTSSNDPPAKNVIFFIGDGMSVQTVTAARIYTGKDEKFDFAFDKMPTSGFAKTYCVDAQIADSACTATAYHTGVKTLMGNIGTDARAGAGTCEQNSNKDYHIESISKWAHDAGMNLGLITTARPTDASPSPLFATSTARWFETDQDHKKSGCDANKLQDIAEQMVHGDIAKHFKVILGGGRSVMLDKSMKDEEGIPGLRGDGKNLIKEWEQIHKKMGKTEYVWNRKKFLKVDPKKTDYLLGLFEGNIMKFNFQNQKDMNEPTLSEMVEMAIKILSKDGKGYYLFVEGGLIDYGHHMTLARVALDETKCLGEALDKAKSMTNPDDTLIVLSADHAHTMTLNGFSSRRNDILGRSEWIPDDGLPSTTLSYSTGPGFKNAFKPNGWERVDISRHDLSKFEYEYPAMLPAQYETHAADDVPIYASGPHNQIFSGAYEQNALPYLMAYAAKIGPYKK